MGFPTKNDHFGVFWGYHHLRKHPYQLTISRQHFRMDWKANFCLDGSWSDPFLKHILNQMRSLSRPQWCNTKTTHGLKKTHHLICYKRYGGSKQSLRKKRRLPQPQQWDSHSPSCSESHTYRDFHRQPRWDIRWYQRFLWRCLLIHTPFCIDYSLYTF